MDFSGARYKERKRERGGRERKEGKGKGRKRGTKKRKEGKEFNVDNRVTSMAGFYGVEAAHTSERKDHFTLR